MILYCFFQRKRSFVVIAGLGGFQGSRATDQVPSQHLDILMHVPKRRNRLSIFAPIEPAGTTLVRHYTALRAIVAHKEVDSQGFTGFTLDYISVR